MNTTTIRIFPSDPRYGHPEIVISGERYTLNHIAQVVERGEKPKPYAVYQPTI